MVQWQMIERESIPEAYDDQSKGEAKMRIYYEGPAETNDDVCLRGRYFTNRSGEALIAGCDFSVIFSIGRSVEEVWPYFKDFNLWQNPHSHYYSGVVGDLEGTSFGLGPSPEELEPYRYDVLRVIPEHLIVISQAIPKAGMRDPYLPGLGGVSPGFHVFMLNRQSDGQTVVTGLMEHASLMQQADQTPRMSEEEALIPWRDEKMVPDWLRKWRDGFIPSLKSLVYGDRRG